MFKSGRRTNGEGSSTLHGSPILKFSNLPPAPWTSTCSSKRQTSAVFCCGCVKTQLTYRGSSLWILTKVFATRTNFLACALRALHQIPAMKPKVLVKSFLKFPHTRIIIDCTEVFCTRPSGCRHGNSCFRTTSTIRQRRFWWASVRQVRCCTCRICGADVPATKKSL